MSPKLHCRSVSCLSVNVTTVGVRVADNVPGLGAVPAIRDYKDNDGAQQNKLFP